MKLTRKQKNLIEKLKDQSPHKIAAELNLDVEQVRNYLEFNHSAVPVDSARPSFSPNLRLFIRENIGKISLIVFLVILVYSSSLPNAMVSDDKPLMIDPSLENPLLILKSGPVNALVNSLTYTLNFFISGTQPFSYHLGNVLLHLATTLAVFFFLSILLNQRIAFLASLLFGIVPLHTEAVSWISGRHYILYTLFSLLSLIFYSLSDRLRGAKLYYCLSLTLFVLAVYSYLEMAIILPLLLLLVDLYRGKILKRVKFYLPFFSLAGLFTLLSLARVQQRIYDVSSISQLSEAPINYFSSVIISLSTYLKLFLLPFGLSFYHESLTFSTPVLLLGGLLIIALLTAPIIFYKKNRLLMLGVGIFVVTLLPTLTPFKVSWVVAERYAYFGSLGLAILLAQLFSYLTEKINVRPLARYALAGLLIISYSLLTFLRGFDWKDEDSLWLATIRTSPTSSKALNNIGDYYGRHGEVQKSFESFVKATQINPTYSDAWHNAGNVLLQNGKFEQSIPYFEKSVQFNPNLIEGYDNMAIAYSKLGNPDKAQELISKSLTINPNAIKTYNALAQIEYENGNIQKAKEAILQGLQIDPNNPTLKQILDFLQNQRPRLP